MAWGAVLVDVLEEMLTRKVLHPEMLRATRRSRTSISWVLPLLPRKVKCTVEPETSTWLSRRVVSP